MKTALTLLDDGRYVEAAVGYRFWEMFGDHGVMFLNSVWHPTQWDDDTRRAESECLCGGKLSLEISAGVWVDTKIAGINGQAVEHRCGIHAWDRIDRFGNQRIADRYVAGEVLLWGDVDVHEFGYRAQHAQISTLYTRSTYTPKHQKKIELASLTYDVPLVSLDLKEVKT